MESCDIASWLIAPCAPGFGLGDAWLMAWLIEPCAPGFGVGDAWLMA